MMLETGNQTIRVVGPAPGGAQFIETVVDEKPLRQAMYRFSRNLLIVGLLIGILTAGLVYVALHFLFVRPMRRLTASMVGFHENPESAARIIVPSQRGDEIGVAERELSDMQRDLVSMLHQKSRLAALGLAVSKINHDLRNLLASVAAVVRPARERARSARAALCAKADALAGARDRLLPVDAVLRPRAGGRARPPHDPDRARGGGGARDRGACDRRLDHLDHRDRARALGRRRSGPAVPRAAQPRAQRGAGAGEPSPKTIRPACRSASPAGARARSRSWKCPTPAPACRRRARDHLFEAFQTSGRPGGSGLGLAIAAELVRAHDGEIHLVEGTLGATFRIVIPDRPVELLTIRNERARA